MILSQRMPLSWATRQAARAVAEGVSLDGLLSRALVDDGPTITPLQLTLLQALLVLETNDITHAMFAHRLAPDIGPLALRVLFGGANLHDGLDALGRFYTSVSRTIRFALSATGQTATLSIRAAEDGAEGLFQEDIQLVYVYFGLTRYLGRPFPVTSVTTRDAGHPNLGAGHYAIGSPLVHGACAGLHFPRALLAAPPPRVGVKDFFWEPMRDALHAIEQPSFDPRTAATNGTYAIRALADESAVSPATLRRRLARQGISFRKSREDAILATALKLLGERAGSIDSIAAELGYADARSMRRFIKRATGRTPDALRTELQSAPPAKLYETMKDTCARIAARA